MMSKQHKRKTVIENEQNKDLLNKKSEKTQTKQNSSFYERIYKNKNAVYFVALIIVSVISIIFNVVLTERLSNCTSPVPHIEKDPHYDEKYTVDILELRSNRSIKLTARKSFEIKNSNSFKNQNRHRFNKK